MSRPNVGSARSALATATTTSRPAGVPDQQAERQGDDARDHQRDERVLQMLAEPGRDAVGAAPVGESVSQSTTSVMIMPVAPPVATG